ncbi:MAG TPA: sigma factor-like helix-turn-helix DNA-binding protein [Clostridia bacterium]|nr:sigma factor-like helix-turn-helix DNA-binding protein [Clostridia bacterium]
MQPGITKERVMGREKIYIEHKGKKQTLAAWAAEIGTPIDRIMARYYRDEPVEKILAPDRFSGMGFMFRGSLTPLQKIAKVIGLSESAVRKRLRRGETADEIEACPESTGVFRKPVPERVLDLEIPEYDEAAEALVQAAHEEGLWAEAQSVSRKMQYLDPFEGVPYEHDEVAQTLVRAANKRPSPGLTLSEIGLKMRMSRERVRQIETDAIRHIRRLVSMPAHVRKRLGLPSDADIRAMLQMVDETRKERLYPDTFNSAQESRDTYRAALKAVPGAMRQPAANTQAAEKRKTA